MKKMTFALAFCNRGFMPGELIYGAREDMIKAVTDAGYDYIAMDAELTRYKVYTVTYVADGKTVAEIPVNHGFDVTNVPAIPEKTGYTDTAPVWDKDGKNITEDTTIKAVYTINEYTVEYVADGVTVDTQTIKHGSDATAPAIPEKTGYTQTAPEWDKDGKGITSDTIITAVYTINKYKVEYVADGITVDTQTVEHGSDAVAPAIPEKEGYTQTAPVWDKDGKNITADTTVNAVYTINEYTVKYVADGKVVDTQTVEHGKDATAPTIPEKTGHTQKAPIWDGDGKSITSDTIITAVYTINKYKVEYVADGITVDTQTVEHGSDATAPAIPKKEGYTQTAPVWDKDGKNVTEDTTINAVYTINKYSITVPEIQTGYTLTVDKAETEWNSDAVITFALADGYSKTNTFAVKVNGNAVELDADSKYTISGIKENVAITVEGVADITAPEAEITIADNKWNSLLNNITFGKFFRETQEVTITAADVNTGSGLNKIYYYIASEPVAESDLTSVAWTEYTDAFTIEPNTEFIIYVWAEDNAGNDKYISSEGLVFDNIAPVITGITEGAVYYGTTGFEVDETYVDSVTDNESAVVLTNGNATIPADGKEHVIIVTDKAGNTAGVTITVKPVEDIDNSITVDNSDVTAGDKEDIQAVVNHVDEILNDTDSDLSEEEKSKLEEIKDHAQGLIDKIAETEKAVDDAVTEENGYESGKVTSDDTEEIADLKENIESLIDSSNTTEEQKKELEQSKADLETLEKEIADAAQAVEDAKDPVSEITSENVTKDDTDELEKAKETLEELMKDSTYTEEEKAAIQKEIDRIDDALEIIEHVEQVEEQISELPDTITKDDADAIEAAKDAYNALTDYEKSLVSKDAKEKLNKAKTSLVELNNSDETEGSKETETSTEVDASAKADAPATGDSTNIFLWLALLLASGGGAVTLSVYNRKRRTAKK